MVDRYFEVSGIASSVGAPLADVKPDQDSKGQEDVNNAGYFYLE